MLKRSSKFQINIIKSATMINFLNNVISYLTYNKETKNYFLNHKYELKNRNHNED